MYRALKLFLTVTTLTATLVGCSVNPVTGETEFSLMSAEQEVALGSSNYGPSQQSQGGRYYIDPDLQIYVQGVGKKLAAVSDRPGLPMSSLSLITPPPMPGHCRAARLPLTAGYYFTWEMNPNSPRYWLMKLSTPQLATAPHK